MSVTDTESAAGTLGAFFRNATDGFLSIPRCLDCGKHHWYPMERCPHCLGGRVGWSPISARGTVYSATMVRYAFTATTRGHTPYGIALVSLDEAPHVRIVCRTETAIPTGTGASGAAVDLRVVPDADDDGTGVVWCSPAESPSGAHP